MDINKIFGAFNSSSKDDSWGYQPYSYSGVPKDFTTLDENHPRYFIKIFQKLVINYTSYGDNLINFLGKSDPELNVSEIKKAGETILYERAYDYISKIDIHDPYHIKILFQEANPKLEDSLNKSLNYFEKEEEYEKCAILKKYLDFLNLSS